VLALAVLAGIGMDALVRSHAQRPVRWWVGGSFLGAAVVVALLWLVGRGRLPSFEAGIRARSFIWPGIEAVLGLVVIGALSIRARRAGPRHRSDGRSMASAGRLAGGVLLLCETAFLVSAGAPLVSSSPHFLVPTPAETALRHEVGTSLVALGTRDCHTPPTLGMHQDINVVYGVHELADWDPLTPEAVFRSFKAATGQPAGAIDAPLILCPAIDSAAVAQRYGVGFILEHAGGARPRGTVFVSTVGNERLYRVPRAAAATLTPLGRDGALPSPDVSGAPVAVTHPDAASWKLTVASATPAVLRLHLTDVPGWHATIDGRSLPLESFAGAMLQARVPSGPHVVELHYWPTTFTAGIVLAIVGVVGLATGVVFDSRRKRKLRRANVAAPLPSE
jgi:hypothetical protein